MKLVLLLFAFVGISLNPLFAQKTSSNQTGPSSTTTVSNHQQELYDHYHSYSRKPEAESTPVTTDRVDAERPVSNPAVSSTPSAESNAQSRPMASAEPMSPEGNASSRIRIGARGGVTYPSFLDKNIGFKPAVGFVGGLVFIFGKGTVSFQPEVNYARHSVKSSDLYGTYTTAADVIEVPLFIKFSTGTYAGNRFFINVGPYASYLASASFEGKKLSLDNLKGRYGFGAAAGIGAALKAGPGHVTIEVRGLYSLGDTDNKFNTDSKTILGEGTIGYIFPLGKGR